MVDQDYKKNKVTVCAHIQNIYNMFCVKRGKATYQMNNYFDIDKWNNKVNNSAKDNSSPSKELRRVNTLASMGLNLDDAPREKENYLLSKSNSTAHIPENIRNKMSKRAYANFDKDLAVKMFGYRVVFKKKRMLIDAPEPSVPQTHKPLQKYVNDIMSELNLSYMPIHRYGTKQRILIPLPDSEDEEEYMEK